MRIVIVCDLLSTFLRYRRFFAQDLVKHGHTVNVLVGSDDRSVPGAPLDDGVDVQEVAMNRTGINPVKDFGYARRLRLAFRRLQPDAVIAYQAKAAVWATIAARSIPGCSSHVLFPGLGYMFSPARNLRHAVLGTLARWLYRSAFRTLDTAIFQNRDDVDTLLDRKILAPQTQVVVVNGSGVPLDDFPYKPVPVGPVRFVMATRLLDDKGVREFVDAARTLHSRYGGQVRFEIAGSTDSNPASISLAEVRDWARDGVVNYRGHVSDMPAYLQDCSVFVMPSYYMEGRPRSILEAMSTGRPIITADTRGCRDTTISGTNGFLVGARDSDALASAMAQFVDNRHLIHEMGLASRRLAEERYDVAKVNAGMMAGMRLARSGLAEGA